MIWDAVLLESKCRIAANALKQCIYAVQIMKLWIQLLDPSKQLQDEAIVPSLINFKCPIVYIKIISFSNPKPFCCIWLHCAVRNSPGSTSEKEFP